MSYREYEPAPALRPWIECFWTSTSAPGSEHLVLPDGCADLVFEDGAGYAVGTMTRALPVRDAAPRTRVAVRFRAGGIGSLLSVPLKALTDARAPLADVAPEPAPLLEAAGADAPLAARVRHLEAALAPRLRPRNPGVVAAVRAIGARRGAVSIAALCADLGWTRQHLARRFAAEVGVSPKVFARITRLQGVLERVWAGEADWCQLAHDAGYADQAHLIGEFKALTGLTPTEYQVHHFGSRGAPPPKLPPERVS